MADAAVDLIGSEDTFLRNKLGEEFGFKKFSDIKKYEHQISRIIEWARGKGAKTSGDVIKEVKFLASHIGSPKLGENWAMHLSTYAYLDNERSRISSELKDLENKDGGQTNTPTPA